MQKSGLAVIMKLKSCQNCQSEMKLIQLSFSDDQDAIIYWCGNCGTILKQGHTVSNNDLAETWNIPKIVDNTKILVQRMLKAEEKASAGVSYANRMTREEMDRVDWGDDDRR